MTASTGDRSATYRAGWSPSRRTIALTGAVVASIVLLGSCTAAPNPPEASQAATDAAAPSPTTDAPPTTDSGNTETTSPPDVTDAAGDTTVPAVTSAPIDPDTAGPEAEPTVAVDNETDAAASSTDPIAITTAAVLGAALLLLIAVAWMLHVNRRDDDPPGVA